MAVDIGTIPVEDEIVFSDVNLEMTQAARDEIAYQVDAVRNAFHFLIMTPKRQRIMRPNWGSNVIRYLFNPVTEDTAYDIKEAILSAAEDWAEDIEIHGSGINVDADSAAGTFNVRLTYSVPKLNNLQIQHQFKLRSLRQT